MPVSASSHLYRLATIWGFTAFAIGLGSSYFQVWIGLGADICPSTCLLATCCRWPGLTISPVFTFSLDGSYLQVRG